MELWKLGYKFVQNSNKRTMNQSTNSHLSMGAASPEPQQSIPNYKQLEERAMKLQLSEQTRLLFVAQGKIDDAIRIVADVVGNIYSGTDVDKILEPLLDTSNEATEELYKIISRIMYWNTVSVKSTEI